MDAILGLILVTVISLVIGVGRGLIRVVTIKNWSESENIKTYVASALAIVGSVAVGLTYVLINGVKPENFWWGALDLVTIVGLCWYFWRTVTKELKINMLRRRNGLLIIYWLGIVLGSYLAGFAKTSLQIELMICVGLLMFHHSIQVMADYEAVSLDTKK